MNKKCIFSSSLALMVTLLVAFATNADGTDTSKVTSTGDGYVRQGQRRRSLDSAQGSSKSVKSASSKKSKGCSKDLSFMTQNVYFGVDLRRLPNYLNADIEACKIGQDSFCFLAVANQAKQILLGSEVKARMQKMIDVVKKQDPIAIGLQEVLVIKVLDNGGAGPELVKVDFLDIILDALESEGLSYEVRSTTGTKLPLQAFLLPDDFNPADVLIPDKLFLTDRDVILVKSEYGTRNAEDSVRFQSQVAGPVEVTLTRGYAAVEVEVQVPSGETKECEMQWVRFVNTHLDLDQPDGDTIQVGQTQELMEQFPSADMPTIVMGDMNAPPGSNVYNEFIGAGYDDAWIEKHGDNKEEDGFTCCQEEFLENEAGELTFRIDYVFVSGDAFKVKKVEIVGTKAIDQTDSGKWYSDHAGLVTKISFKK